MTANKVQVSGMGGNAAWGNLSCSWGHEKGVSIFGLRDFASWLRGVLGGKHK